jgi:hypothetical protein
MILKKLSEDFIKKINFSWYSISIFLIIISINVNPSFIQNNISSEIFTVNFIRFFSGAFFTIFLIVYLIYFKKKKYFYNKNLLKDNIEILILLLLFLIFFLFSLLNYNSITNILYFINYFNIFIFGYLMSNFNKKIIFRNIIYFISITFLIYFFFIIFELINNPWALFELNKAQILQFDSRILNEATPRSTGAAKGILIFTFLIFFDQFLNKNKIIKNIIIFLLGFIIFSLFSRTAILFYFFLNIFYFIFVKKKIKVKIIFISFSLILPIIFFFVAANVYSKSLFKTENYIYKNNNTKDNTKELIMENINRSSSGRIFIWKKMINEKENFFIGNGILADKFQYEESASNGFVYTYLSGGLIATSILIIFKILVLKKIYVSISKKIKSNYLPSIIILFVFFRFIFENGYVAYMYELFLLVFSLIYLNKNLTIKPYSINRPKIYNK